METWEPKKIPEWGLPFSASFRAGPAPQACLRPLGLFWDDRLLCLTVLTLAGCCQSVSFSEQSLLPDSWCITFSQTCTWTGLSRCVTTPDRGLWGLVLGRGLQERLEFWIESQHLKRGEKRKEVWVTKLRLMSDRGLYKIILMKYRHLLDWWFSNSGLRMASRSPKQYKGSLEVKTIYFPNTKMLQLLTIG